MLDIFRNNAFSVLALTDRINKVPFVPGRAGQVINWNESGIRSLYVAIEEQDGELKIINPSPRGAPGDTIKKPGRTMRVLRVPHYQIDDAINADEVQGVRAFGTEDELQTVQGIVDQRNTEHVQLRLDPTLEYQRVGAIKGIILNGDGTTLYNLYTEFGVSAPAVVDFDLDNATPLSGIVRTKSTQVQRVIADALGGIPFSGMYAFCGDAFYDQLIANKETRETYLNQSEARTLREAAGAFSTFNYGGITWENYRGSVGGTPFIPTDDAYIFPVGVPGLFKTVYAPADYMETVNTLGLPRYAKQFPMPNDKGVNSEVQTNALSYCTRPNVLQRVTRT